MTMLERNQFLAIPGPPSTAHVPNWTAAPPDPLSFGFLLGVLRRRYRIFFSVLLLAVLASFAAAKLLPVRYSAEARVMVDPRPRGSPVSADSRSSVAPDASLFATEVEVMTSPDVIRAVAQRLNLGSDPEFTGGSTGDPVLAATEALTDRVSVSRDGVTYLVAVRAQSRDRVKAARIANTMAAEYLRQSQLKRSQLAADQARVLTAELGPLGRQVVEADDAVAAYRAQHGIVASLTSTGGTLTDQQMSTMAAELGRASAEAAAVRAAASAARAQTHGAGVEAITQVLNSDSLSELRKQRAQVQREQAQIATVYGPQHPASARINEQLARLDREINQAANGIVRGMESDAAAATARQYALRQQLAQLQERQEIDSKANVVALSLQRAADAKRNIYNDLSRNAQQQAQEARIGDVRAWIVSAAQAPLTPSFPKTSVFLMLGLAIGSAAGVGAVVVAEARERGFRSAEDVETALNLPLLAAVPELSAKRTALARRRRRASLPAAERTRVPAASPWNYVLDRPASSFAESIRNIRASLLDETSDAGPRTVCVTSAVAGEGKSVIAVALARVMAMSGDRVLLIDCDLRRTGLAHLRPDQTRPGLMDVLDGVADAGAALNEDVVDGLTFLGQDSPVFTARDIFSGPAAKEMLRRVRGEYDFVILDAPPVLAVTDAWTISSLCDATLLVVRQARTPPRAVRSAMDRLLRRGARLHGVVLNRRPHGSAAEAAGYYDGAHADYYDE
jgi:capsular exopolysaccharide synthesis family protein